MQKIILASASPRRQELLSRIGLKFDIEPGNCEEDISPELEPHELARSLSLQKAKLVAVRHKNALIIAADTFIVAGGRIMGKPHTENEARTMLKTICGRSHSVITGFSLIDTTTGKTLSDSVETKVHIRKLTLAEIDAYVKTREPLDKAGGYAIQGLGAVIVNRIEGDYYNVMGLPLSALTEALREFGVRVL